jgi:hypothetical protein
MGVAIKLDDQFRMVTNEIGDIAADRHLAAEMIAIRPEPAQHGPEHTLGRCR